MATMIPEALDWWATEAVRCLSSFDQRQYSSDDSLNLKRYQERVAAQGKQDYGFLLRQLIDTGDSECLACAARYDEAVKAEK